MRDVLLVLSLATWTGAAFASDTALAEIERIGPYELEHVAGGLEIRSSALLGSRRALGIAAALCIATAAAVAVLAPRILPGAVLGAAGLALAVVAARIPPGADRVRVGEADVFVQGFTGRQGTTHADEIGVIEIQRRTPTGAETKRSPRPRVWQVTLRRRTDAAAVAQLRVSSRREATTLAARIGAVLERPVSERQDLAR